jgi:hypothetical protein
MGKPDSLVTGREDAPARSTIHLDGMGGSDTYRILLTGETDYLVTVADSGAPDNGVDRLQITGTEDASNTFLLRAQFVTRLQVDGDGGFLDTYERINYDRSINVLEVNGGLESDRFYVDDNSAITYLDGRSGDN